MAVPQAPRPARSLRDFLQTMGAALILALLVRTYLVEVFRVEGSSMEGTLQTGERVVVSKVSGMAMPGEIIVFEYPRDRNRIFIKRVAAVAGDRLAIRGGQVFRNGTPIMESPTARPSSDEMRETTVPPESVWVLGDNRSNSEDSRDFGEVPAEHVRGKVIARIWPIADFCRFRTPSSLVQGEGRLLVCR